MLGLILFTSFAIITISKTTCRNIKKRTMKLVSLYDYMLEEHSQELKNKKKIIEQLGYQRTTSQEIASDGAEKKVVAMGTPVASTMNTVESISRANYLSPKVAEMYQEIRTNFNMDVDSILQQVPNVKEPVKTGIATRLLRALSYENIYAMSFLSEQEQLECMEECLESRYIPLLETYLEQNETFFSLDFYSFLKEEAYKEDQGATIYVSPNIQIKDTSGIRVVVSDNICEGIQVEKDHMLYDYAIQKKEIG